MNVIYECIGKSRGGRTTKIHAVVDASGYPIRLRLTAGHVHDVTVASALIGGLNPAIILADGSYDSLAFREEIKALGAQACIKPRRNRKLYIPFDKEQYKRRHLVECFFQKLKINRRIATRYDKLTSRFLAFVLLACILL